MTKRNLRVLILEDNPSDSELVAHELKRANFSAQLTRVETEADYLAHLNGEVDIILSDYGLPQFDGLRALRLLKERQLDIPFIIISGTIGEETAVAAMRDGADDYLLKDRLARLGQAVDQALAQKRAREERKQAEEKLNRLTQMQEAILNSVAEGIHGMGLDGKITFENKKGAELLGWTPSELIGQPAHATMHHTHPNGDPYLVEECPIYQCMRDGQTRRITNDVIWRKDGSFFRADYVAAPTKDAEGKIVGCIVTFRDYTEEFVAEQRLKLQEQQYRLLFEGSPNAMWVFDLKTLRILAVNDAALQQYGYSREEFLKLKMTDLRLPEERVAAVKDLQQRPSTYFSGERRHIRKDGAVIDVVIYSSSLIWNSVAARIVTAIDVTERRRVEAELSATHERLRELLAHTPAVIYSLKVEGEKLRPIFVSENVERLLGASVVESTSFEWWWERLHPDERGRVLDVVMKSLSGDGYYSIEYRVRHKDGSYHWIQDSNRLVRGEDGQPTEMVGVWVDITEHKKIEQRLREQSEIIDCAQDAILIRNFTDLRISFWNKGAERLYGWTAQEVLHRSDISTLSDPQQSDNIISTLQTAGEFRGEVKQVTKDGRQLTSQARVTLVRNEDGTPRSVLIICTDITEQKKLETQLLRAQRLESIGTLASGVAHDLNNILTPILMCAETLRSFDLPPEDRQSAAALIDESARRGANVVKQVLTFARGVEGERVVISPKHLLEEMTDIARKTFPKSIETNVRYSEDLWPIKGDPTQLHQVLLNICVNARDAMPNGGSLTLAAEEVDLDESYAATMPGAKVGPHVLVRITDTGLGMPRAIIDKIFDPFFTTKELGKGTGLGLSTALGIVKSHGGFLSASSEPGSGTTFRIYLPAADAQATTTITPMEQIIKGHNELIMLVDDEEIVRQVMKMSLENNNYRALEAKDGPEALAIFAQQMDAIQLIITDMMLPHMDGATLVRTVKKMRPNVPVIVSSGQCEQARANELRSVGVNNFLPKPYDTKRLLAAVHKALP